MLTIGSLFSGIIGGLELGLEWAGLGPTLWQVEREPFCRAVLEKHWPQAERFDDVCTVGSANLAPVQLICGGFPCQDVSSAGKGAGLAGERSGLWREFARVVGELRPEWVVVENVKSGARRWLDQVVRELEQLGYAVLPVPVSARDVGAPHIRERMFLVAHAAQELGECDVVLPQQQQLLGDRAHAADSIVPWTESVAHTRGVDDGFPNRMDRRAALGNAVVPQCAEVVGWVIRELMAERSVA